jgi:transposase
LEPSVTWWQWWVSRVRCCVVPARLAKDASGYAHLFELLGSPEGCLLALEATGHYWRNLFVASLAKGYAVAVLNPLRTRRFA